MDFNACGDHVSAFSKVIRDDIRDESMTWVTRDTFHVWGTLPKRWHRGSQRCHLTCDMFSNLGLSTQNVFMVRARVEHVGIDFLLGYSGSKKLYVFLEVLQTDS